MRKIWFGFSTPISKFNALSAVIRKVQKSEFSHAYIRLQVADRTVIYQASGLAVNFQNHEFFLSKEEVIKEFAFEIDDVQYTAILNFCIDNLNKPYGLMDLFGMGLMKIFRLKTNPFGDQQRKWICVELAAAVAEQLGMDSKENLETMDLLDLYELLVAHQAESL